MQIAKTNRTNVSRSLLFLGVLLVLGLTGPAVKADPLFFSNVTAFQNNDTVQVNLYSNPGVTLYGSTLTFSVDITGVLPPGGGDTLRITYTELGNSPVVQDFQIPLFGTIQPPFSLVFSVFSPGSNPQGVPATLTIDLLNSVPDFVIPGGPNQGQPVNSQTYTFNVAEPVPEPATLSVFFGGLVALGVRVRRRTE
ncbi:MAG TPA: PEP-CTERM sorting domain-containing protein [Pyrinomonadaceae bacterium]|nr:PEP-CTERM sorting domain-containing protein [Pyrinomonadaceae bacterium]